MCVCVCVCACPPAFVKFVMSAIHLSTLSGTIDLDLSAMPLPEHKAEMDQVSTKVDNLFKRKQMKGWWPVHDKHGTKSEVSSLLSVNNKEEREYQMVYYTAGIFHQDNNLASCFCWQKY